MPLGTEVGLGPGHTVLDGDPTLPPKGLNTPIFVPCLLWPNGRPFQLLLSTCFISVTITFTVIVNIYECTVAPKIHRTVQFFFARSLSIHAVCFSQRTPKIKYNISDCPSERHALWPFSFVGHFLKILSNVIIKKFSVTKFFLLVNC